MEVPTRRVDASMSLLVDTMANTLDQGYADRAAAAGPPRRLGVLGTVLLVALGVLTGTAVAEVRSGQEAGRGVRSELLAQADERGATGDALAARSSRLRTQLDGVRADALGRDEAGRAALEHLQALGLASATLPVRGPGLVVTLDDAPADGGALDLAQRRGPGSGEPGASRVHDRDLQQVVNGLWAAGAEAVAVNGQRLTAVTAIRSAGETVLVDFAVLSPPYLVRAVGPAQQLEVRFVDGPVGRRLAGYPQLYGISVQVERSSDLRLPGASVRLSGSGAS